MYEAISEVAELEEKAYVELKVESADLYSIQVIMPFSLKIDIASPHMCITYVSQGINEFVKAMEQTSYNIKAGLPDLLDHSRKILGL